MKLCRRATPLPCARPARPRRPKRQVARALYGGDDLREMERMLESAARAQRKAFSDLEARGQGEYASTIEERESISSANGTESYTYYRSVYVGPLERGPAAGAGLVPFLGGFGSFLALMLGAAYAYLTYKFNRNYDASPFRDDQRLKLSLIWPGLMLSPGFREKFFKVVDGKRD